MARYEVLVCADCGMPVTVEDDGNYEGFGYLRDCRHTTDPARVPVDVNPYDLEETVADARWETWMELWDREQAKRQFEPPKPYLDPALDWTPAGRRHRREQRILHGPLTTSLFSQVIKDVWSNPSALLYGNAMRVPVAPLAAGKAIEYAE